MENFMQNEDFNVTVEDDIKKLIELGYIKVITDQSGDIYYKMTSEGYKAYINSLYYQEGKFN